MPQGCVISRTLFLVYINHIITTVPKQVSNTLHADDFAVWSSEESTAQDPGHHQQHQRMDRQVEYPAHKNQDSLNTVLSVHIEGEDQPEICRPASAPQVKTPTFLGVDLDTGLTWRPHTQTAEARAYRRLSPMKLAGTNWGASSDIPQHIHTGAAQPDVEHAATSGVTAFKSNMNKLDKAQDMGLTILGAMRTTSIKEMEKLLTLSHYR